MTCNLHGGARHKQLPGWITWWWRVMILWTRLCGSGALPLPLSLPRAAAGSHCGDLMCLLVHWVVCAVCHNHCVPSVCHLAGRSVLMHHVELHAWLLTSAWLVAKDISILPWETWSVLHYSRLQTCFKTNTTYSSLNNSLCLRCFLHTSRKTYKSTSSLKNSESIRGQILSISKV